MINGLSKKILGLDIRTTSISAVSAKISLKGLRVEDYITVETSEPITRDSEAFVNAVKSVTSQLDTGGAQCFVSLPFHHLSFRQLTVPFREKRKIRQILSFEVEPLLPGSFNDLIIDFRPVVNEENSRQTDLIIAAVHQQELEFFLDAFKSLNWDPESVTMGNYTLAKVLSHTLSSEKDWILADINPDRVDLSFCIANQVRALRSFNTTRSHTQQPADIATRINQTILAVQQQFNLTHVPEKIFLTGNPAAVDQLISDRLDVPTESLDITRMVDTAFDQTPSDENKRAIQSALALCMAEARNIPTFNFRKGPFAKKKFWLEHTQDLIRTGSIAAAIILLLVIGVFVKSYAVEKQVADLDRQILTLLNSAYPEATTTTGALEKIKVKIRGLKETTLFSDETETVHRSIDIMNDISKLTPKNLDVKLDKLSISSGNVLISGDTATFNMVDDLKGKLETSEIFTSVDITSANLDKSGERVDFKLKLQLK